MFNRLKRLWDLLPLLDDFVVVNNNRINLLFVKHLPSGVSLVIRNKDLNIISAGNISAEAEYLLLNCDADFNPRDYADSTSPSETGEEPTVKAEAESPGQGNECNPVCPVP